MNLEKYCIPLKPAPDRIQDLLTQGVSHAHYPDCDDVATVLDGVNPPQEGIWRARDGKVLIVCNTDLPDVTPAMIDWWFGWHLPSSERYRLWHPVAHIATRVKEDRSHLPNSRDRYIGNESHVDEFIGKQLKRLSIEFVTPQQFGFFDLDARNATAICGMTKERMLRADGGHLCHLILPTASGSQMRSGFWLGDIHHHFSWVHRFFGRLYNSAPARKLIISDRMCVDLLQHCSEEITHLARFLPTLYHDMKTSQLA